jgi:hypothetical protein
MVFQLIKFATVTLLSVFCFLTIVYYIAWKITKNEKFKIDIILRLILTGIFLILSFILNYKDVIEYVKSLSFTIKTLPFHSPIIYIIVMLFGLIYWGFLMYHLKQKILLLYSFFEMIVGSLGAILVILTQLNLIESKPYHKIIFTIILATVSGLYVVVRGIENFDKGLNQRNSKYLYLWKKINNWIAEKRGFWIEISVIVFSYMRLIYSLYSKY